MKSSTLWFLCIAAVILGILFALGTRELSNDQAAPGTARVMPSEGDELVVFRLFDVSRLEPAFDEFGRSVPAIDGENLADTNRALKRESLTIDLALDGAVEYKALMNQGDTLVYAWQARGGDVYYDFHAHPPDANPDFFTRYKEGEGQADQGTVLAAYAGQHGWYWLNISNGPVSIELEVAGFYDELVKIELY